MFSLEFRKYYITMSKTLDILNDYCFITKLENILTSPRFFDFPRLVCSQSLSYDTDT